MYKVHMWFAAGCLRISEPWSTATPYASVRRTTGNGCGSATLSLTWVQSVYPPWNRWPVPMTQNFWTGERHYEERCDVLLRCPKLLQNQTISTKLQNCYRSQEKFLRIIDVYGTSRNEGIFHSNRRWVGKEMQTVKIWVLRWPGVEMYSVLLGS